MTDEPDEELAARVRAALKYCEWRLSRTRVAEALGVSVRTLTRMTESPPKRRPTQADLDQLAELTGMPRVFMHHGPQPDFVTMDEHGNLLTIEAKDDADNGQTLTQVAYRVAAIETFLSHWINEDPALFAAPLPEMPESLFEPLPGDEDADPTRETAPPADEQRGRRRAGGRRRAA